MALSPFLWNDNRAMTPEQVKRERERAAQQSQVGNDFSPVGHWTQGAARLVSALGGHLREGRADRAEDAGASGARGIFDALMGGGGAGPQGYETTQGTYVPSNTAPVNPVDAMFPLGQDASQPIPQEPYSMGQNVATAATPESIRAGLIARGLPEHVAEGFLPNFQDESGLNPGINEIAPLVPGSRGGFGLAQWTGPRRRALEAFAQQRGVDPSDVDLQLDFLVQELQGPESKAARAIMSTKDAPSAAAAIVNSFLRPAEEHRSARAARYMGGGGQVSPVVEAMASSPSSQSLMAAMADPWVAQQYGPVIQALAGQAGQRENAIFQQQLAQQDPMYQARLAQMSAPQVNEYDQRAAAAAQFGLSGDQATAFALTGNVPGMGGAGTPAEIQALQWRAQESGLQPGTQEYKDFVRNGGRVTNGMPAAVAALHEQALRSGLIEGSPEYQNFMLTRGAGQVAAASTTGKAEAEMQLSAPAEINSADDTLRYIQELRDHPGRKAGTGASSWTSVIPGTQSKDFGVRVAQLEGGAFLTAIGEMQGMGALSNQEGQTAKAAIARLNTATTEEGFMSALDDYERIIRRGRDRAQKRVRVGDAPTSPPAADASDDDLMRKYGIE